MVMDATRLKGQEYREEKKRDESEGQYIFSEGFLTPVCHELSAGTLIESEPKSLAL